MNKFAKGSLAAGAGIVLLLGGAGTLAYWNDQAELNGAGSINAGQLTLEAAEGAWAPEITTWVPGDESRYTTTLRLDADGDNIQGTIALDEESVVITGDDADQFDLTVSPTADSLPQGLTYDETTEAFTFEGGGEYEIPVQIEVTFPFGTEPTNASQGAQVDLSAVTFTATQTAADGAVTE